MYCCPTSTEDPLLPEQCSDTGKTIDGKKVPAVATASEYVTSMHQVSNTYGYT